MRGRDFNEHDAVKTSQVVIVSEQLSRDLWPNIKDVGDAVGRQVRLGPENRSYEIIGVARDARNSIFRSLDGPPQSTVYRSFNQDYSALASIVLRTSANPTSYIPLVRREVAALDANLPAQDLQPLTENVSLALWSSRTGAAVLGVFSLLGLTLAAVGIYGVMSYSVAQRTKEVGVRMALGADASDVLYLVVWHGARLALIGSAIGLALAFLVTRVLASLLYGVGPADPLTFLSVTVFLISVALIACFFPARRATRVDPLTALRHD